MAVDEWFARLGCGVQATSLKSRDLVDENLGVGRVS
jgi:hypothetical protein